MTGNSEHALYAPSSSERWLRCPGSVAICKDLPDDSGEEADEGSFLHMKAEICARYGIEPFDLIGEYREFRGRPYEFTYEHATMLAPGLDWLEEDAYGADEVLYEERVRTFSDEFGTPDRATLKGQHLTIFDWKFGRYGVRAKDNTQLGCYAIGHINRIYETKGIEVNKVTLAIAQPRITQEIEEETYTDMSWFKELEEKAYEAIQSDEIIAGAEQCVFCPARFFCGEFRNYVMELLDFMVENADKYKNLSNEDVERLIVNKKLITDLLKNVEDEALHRLESGVEFKEIDLVEGRTPPADWTKGETDIVEFFTRNTTLRKEELYTSNLKSPAQVLELLGKSQPDKVKLVAENSKRGTAKNKVVPRFGKGKRVQPVSDMFNDF